MFNVGEFGKTDESDLEADDFLAHSCRNSLKVSLVLSHFGLPLRKNDDKWSLIHNNSQQIQNNNNNSQDVGLGDKSILIRFNL